MTFLVLKAASHWSHDTELEVAVSSSVVVRTEEFCFFFANSSLRLAFLQSVEGLALFLVSDSSIALLLVSREKEKFGPITMEKLKAWPWLASAWQNSMHLEAREEFTSSTAVILCLLLNYDFSEAEEEHAVFQCLLVQW